MRFVLRMLGVGAVASAVAVACGGSDFSSADAPKGTGGAGAHGGSGGTAGSSDAGASGDGFAAGTAGSAGQAPGSGGASGASASGGTAGGGTTLCSDAKDCDDKDPCTLDTCLANGVCDYPAKCGGDAPKCYMGVCSQCLGSNDCDDGIDCTVNTCFAGVCTFTPGGNCGTDAYCSTNPADGPDGCLPLEDCDTDADCDKQDPCTKDSCVDHKCSHPICPDGGECCPGVGCGECCGDSQCTQSDPCNPIVCSKTLTCEPSPLCANGDLCCKSADGTSASCGDCCEAGECPDDGIQCTDPKCKANSTGFFVCSQEPNPDKCPVGQTCDPTSRGCSANQCKSATECAAPSTCKKVACSSGQCVYSPVDCSHGQECCGTTGTCRDCCDNGDCNDSAARFCCPKTGACAACCQDSDCQLAQPVSSGPVPQAITGGTGGTDLPCPGPATCQVGTCVTGSTFCAASEKCCPGVGCVSILNMACPVTL